MNTLTQVLAETSETPIPYRFGCQVQQCSARTTKSQKPYFELQLVDIAQTISLKVWSNHPQFDQVPTLKPGMFLAIEGNFTKSQYGLESNDWQWSSLGELEKEQLLSGDPSLRAKQDQDYQAITTLVAGINDPRLKGLCNLFLSDFGAKFQRAAAARKNHHARRGGLVEHVSLMMQSAAALCTVYPQLNKDLLLTAVLFHDCGKLWENNYPEEDFHQVYTLHAEALGHISLGIELVNKLWKDLITSQTTSDWQHLSPPNEHVRIHLLHLIASHHGQLDFGSPVVPKTPEAFALHYIDNLDAKMEMCAMSYESSSKLANNIHEKMFPLPSNLLTPLPHHQPEER